MEGDKASHNYEQLKTADIAQNRNTNSLVIIADNRQQSGVQPNAVSHEEITIRDNHNSKRRRTSAITNLRDNKQSTSWRCAQSALFCFQTRLVKNHCYLLLWPITACYPRLWGTLFTVIRDRIQLLPSLFQIVTRQWTDCQPLSWCWLVPSWNSLQLWADNAEAIMLWHLTGPLGAS